MSMPGSPPLRRFMHVRLLAPYMAEPLGLALAALVAGLVAALGGTATFCLSALIALVVSLRVLSRWAARSPLAVVLPSRVFLEWCALLGSLGVMGFGTWAEATALRRWLWVLDGWHEVGFWLWQVLVPLGLGACWLFWGASQSKRPLTPALQAWLFGHRPSLALGGWSARVVLPGLVPIALWALASFAGDDAARHALAAVARYERIERAAELPGQQVRGQAWAGWSATRDGAVVAALLPRLLEAEGGAGPSIVGAWLSPLVPDTPRPAALDKFAGGRFARGGAASTARDAVLLGLRSACVRAGESSDDVAKSACEPLVEADFGRLMAWGPSHQREADRLVDRAATLGQRQHPLLGGWAREHGLCEETLEHVGWGRQLALIHRSALCHGLSGPKQHARRVARAFAATRSGHWRLPSGAGGPLRLSNRLPGCSKGTCAWLRRPPRALRDIRRVAQRAFGQVDEAPRWQRRVRHLWTWASTGKAAWAGAAVIDQEWLRGAHCRSMKGREWCKPIYGARIQWVGAAGEQTLAFVRASSWIKGCDDAEAKGSCLAPADEGRPLLGVSWTDAAGEIRQVSAAQLLSADWPGAGSRNKRFAEELANGDSMWLATLLRRPKIGLPATVTLRLGGGTHRSLRHVTPEPHGRMPVLRLLLSRPVLSAAVSDKATGKGACAQWAERLELIRSERQRWHSETPTGAWYEARLGGSPKQPVCVLAPLIAVEEGSP